MKYLFDSWGEAKKRLSCGTIALFLDYDGTLSPIAATPEKAKLPRGMKVLLQRLSRMLSLRLAVISGRALRDVKKMVGIRDFVYAGNHGLEAKGPAVRFINPAARGARVYMRDIRNKLRGRLRHIPGALVEDKGLTLSIHFRLAAKKNIAKVRNIVTIVTRPFTKRKKIVVRGGKKVLEIRPRCAWGKGDIVAWLLKHYRASSAAPLYIGDDLTDEDAFRMLRAKKTSVTVRVGRKKSSKAEYYLNGTDEVKTLLMRVADLLRDKNT